MNLRLSSNCTTLRAIHHVTSQVASTYCQIRSHVWHMSVHCSPIAACTARYRLLGLPHPDVLNPVFSSATVPTKQQSDYTSNRSKRPAPIAISGDCAAPPKSQKRHCVRMSLGRSDRRPSKRVSSRESAIRAFVLPRPLARFFAGGEGKNSGLLCYASDPPVEPQKPPRAVPFPLLGGTAAASVRCCRYGSAKSKRLAVAVSGAARCACCLADALEQRRWGVLVGTRRSNMHAWMALNLQLSPHRWRFEAQSRKIPQPARCCVNLSDKALFSGLAE